MPITLRPALWLAPAGVLLAGLWPLTAYAVSPLLMPAGLALGGLAVAVVRRPALGVASVLTLAPLQNLTVGSVRPLNLLIPAMTFALVALLVLRPVDKEVERGRSFLLRPAALGMVGAGLLSSLLAIDPAHSVNDMTVLLVAAALLFAVMEVGRRPEDVMLVIAGAVAGLALAACHGLLQQVTGDFHAFAASQSHASVGRLQGAFGHPNAYGSFLALLMPVAGALALTRGAGRGLRLLGAVALLLAVPAIFVVQSSYMGRLGRIGFVLTMIGGIFEVAGMTTVLVIQAKVGLHGHEKFIMSGSVAPHMLALSALALLFYLGVVLFGVATVRAGIFPRRSGQLVITGSVAMVAGALPDITGLVAAGAILLFAGFAWMGWQLWIRRPERLI
jgi:hypothetical protein